MSFLPLLIRPWMVEHCSDPGESLCLAGGWHSSVLTATATSSHTHPGCQAAETNPQGGGRAEQTRAAEGPISSGCLLLESAGTRIPRSWESLHHTHAQPREKANNTSSPYQSIVRLISLASIKHSDALCMEHKALLNSRAEQSQ